MRGSDAATANKQHFVDQQVVQLYIPVAYAYLNGNRFGHALETSAMIQTLLGCESSNKIYNAKYTICSNVVNTS